MPNRMGNNLTVPTLYDTVAPKKMIRMRSTSSAMKPSCFVESGTYESSREGILSMMCSLLATSACLCVSPDDGSNQ